MTKLSKDGREGCLNLNGSLGHAKDSYLILKR